MEAFVSAGEYSGDRHAAETVRELNKLFPQLRWFGVAGPELRAAGVEPLVQMEELNRMGSSEVLSALHRLARLLKKVRAECFARRPAIALVVDSPDFQLRLIRGFRRASIPVFYLAPPKAWAWRTRRTKILTAEVTRVLSLFKFEHEFFLSHGVPSVFVGNPLADRLTRLVGSTPRVPLRIACLPGSRHAELVRHLPLVREVAARVRLKHPQADFRVPVPRIDSALRAQFEKVAVVTEGGAQETSWGELLSCQAALVKSGTSTLEAALLGTPQTIVYRPSWLTYAIYRSFVRYRGPIALSNILAQRAGLSREASSSEFVGRDLHVDQIAQDLLRQLESLDSPARAETLRLAILEQVQASPGSTAGAIAARAIHESLEVDRPRIYGVTAFPPATRVASFVWSGANSVRRSLAKNGVRLNTRVISVGNLQAGGAGKTPIVAQIAREAVARGLKVAVLSRGYRGRLEKSGGVIAAGPETAEPAEVGDEVALLHHLVPEAWIGVGANRVRQFESIERAGFKPEVTLLDDGFQYLHIKKDVELLAVTSLGPAEYPQREFAAAARLADLVLWTKGDQRPQALSHAKAWAALKYALPKSQGESIVLVTGVGHGPYVRTLVEHAGFRVVRHLQLRDHASPSLQLVHQALEHCQSSQLRLGLTGKDWIKWRSLIPGASDVVVFEPELRFVEGESEWKRVLWGG